MNIKEKILNKIIKNGKIKSSEIVKETRFSREHINNFFQELRKEGKIILIGNGRGAYYILNDAKKIIEVKKKIKKFEVLLKNVDLSEDNILKRVKLETGIFLGLSENIQRILEYSFLEILNNAIEHSEAQKIRLFMIKDDKKNIVEFSIKDFGIGIFNNIQNKKKLKNELEAVQELLKGKQTTMPKNHSGQGIFFTSKLADTLDIVSYNKRLFFNNEINDIFLFDHKMAKGTEVVFSISLKSKKKIRDVFDEYSTNNFEFDKTKIHIKLYKLDSNHISRSQARRLLFGLEEFKNIILDFKNVETVGQAFADEIFRVWKNDHSKIRFEVINSNENIDFMIKRAKV